MMRSKVTPEVRAGSLRIQRLQAQAARLRDRLAVVEADLEKAKAVFAEWQAKQGLANPSKHDAELIQVLLNLLRKAQQS